jgi:arylsulfate sulfotransferase
MKWFSWLSSSLILIASPLMATVTVQLTSTTTSVPVGETINFTAIGKDTANPNAVFTYQFSMRPSGSGPYSVIKDFYTSNTLAWTESSKEGAYDVGVVAKTATGGYASTIETVHVMSRITGSSPVVSGTQNPLVALYSAPPCSAPATVRVRFSPGSIKNTAATTPAKPCNGSSVNFYIAGMTPNTAYAMQQELFNGGISPVRGPVLTFHSGNVVNAHLPSHNTSKSWVPPTSITNPILFRQTLGFSPFATDANENIVWYGLWYQTNDTGLTARLLDGGTFTVIQDDPVHSNAVCPKGHTGGCGDHQFLREFDLASHLVHETSWTVLNGEVNNVQRAAGKPAVRLIDLSHDGIRLPNGYWVTLTTDEQIKDQGAGPVDVIGDVVVVMDQNLQANWVWDAFNHLDVKRRPVVPGNVCANGAPGCPAHLYNTDPKTGKSFTSASDWTHCNSVFYDPSDGNIIVSSRNQSWVFKIAYENGAGDGHVVWILGNDGTFSLPSGAPSTDWFSGQHDARIQSNGLLTLFDDGNERVTQYGGNSRGQAWQLDLTHKIATPVVNDDLGSYSFALGSAQLESNGSYVFNSGIIGGAPTAQITEFNASGTLISLSANSSQTYRSYRLQDLYTTP